MEKHPEGYAGLDRVIRVLFLPTPLAQWFRLPSLDGLVRDPKGDVPALHQCAVVLSPVGGSVTGLVVRMNSGALGCHGQDSKQTVDSCTNAELQELGARQGINVYPLIMGLAKKKLGMGRPKSSVRKPSAARRVSREPGASVSSSKDPSQFLNNFVAHMKRLEQDNEALRSTLKQIANLVR
jgi:hypothetical protein